MLLKQLWILGCLAWWVFWFGLGIGVCGGGFFVCLFSQLHTSGPAFFNFNFPPDANSVILTSCSPVSLLWRGRGFYLQAVAVFMEVEVTPWFILRASGTAELLGSNIPVFFPPSFPVAMDSVWWVRTGLSEVVTSSSWRSWKQRWLWWCWSHWPWRSLHALGDAGVALGHSPGVRSTKQTLPLMGSLRIYLV